MAFPLEQPPDSRTPFQDIPWQQWFTKLWKRVSATQVTAKGSVVLTSGTKSVTTTVTGPILLSVSKPVNQGFLSYTATSTGFTVNSSSSTDASTVSWITLEA